MRIMRSELSWYKRSETIRPISVLVHVTCDLLAGHTFAYILRQIHACRHNTSREHRPWCTSRAPLVLEQHSSWGQTGADKQEEVRSESQQINHLQKSCDPPMGYRLHHMDLYNTKKVLDKKSAGGSHKPPHWTKEVMQIKSVKWSQDSSWEVNCLLPAHHLFSKLVVLDCVGSHSATIWHWVYVLYIESPKCGGNRHDPSHISLVEIEFAELLKGYIIYRL